MNLEKYTHKSQEALLSAQSIAEDLSHQTIEPTHLLLSLILQEDGVVPVIITQVAGSITALEEELTANLNGRPKVSGDASQLGLSRQSGEVLKAAERFAKGMKDDYVSTEHLLLGLTESNEGDRRAAQAIDP